MKRLFLFFALLVINSVAFSQLSKKAISNFLEDSTVKTGFAGICIYEPATKKYFYNYNENKNFVPCSNMKLFSLYAGLKYLGDSILTAKIIENDNSIYIDPAGDPTFLHKDYENHALLNYLKNKTDKQIIVLNNSKDKFEKYGSGWAWNDFSDDYMVERNRFPLFGNVFTFYKEKNTLTSYPTLATSNTYFDNQLNTLASFGNKFEIKRNKEANTFFLKVATSNFKKIEVPFLTDNQKDQLELTKYALQNDRVKYETSTYNFKNESKIYSHPVDSMFKPMMWRSDNFFAEQTLLMASLSKLGYMSDEIFIDSLLKTDFKDLPTKPNWVDGSGLSRYNLFSTNNFIYLLEKLRSEFGMERLKGILTTGGQGTLTNFYETEKGLIYAKTGSMSGHVALSGFLYTKKGKLLEFSIMINNFTGAPRGARRAIERLLKEVILKN